MRERLKQARESIEEAELLYKEGVGNKLVIAKLYHAMIYCLLALFRIRDIGELTHADIIERFEKEYVLKGIFSNELLRVIRHAYELTHECDCEHMPMPTHADIESSMSATQELIVQLEKEQDSIY
ncbi:MAG: HEPN domain-containing protein [Thermodesulfovibrionales bacterium]